MTNRHEKFANILDEQSRSTDDLARRGMERQVLGYGPRGANGEPLRILIEVPTDLDAWQAYANTELAKARQQEMEWAAKLPLDRPKDRAQVKRGPGRPRKIAPSTDEIPNPSSKTHTSGDNAKPHQTQDSDQHLRNVLMGQIRNDRAQPLTHEQAKAAKETQLMSVINQHADESESEGSPPTLTLSW